MTEPKVFLIGEQKLLNDVYVNNENIGLNEYLKHINAEDYKSKNYNNESELLVEIYGRLCYRSFKPGLNKNVTKVREGNDKYISNIKKSGHGSVLEHSTVNFIFSDVSRVFTHELVRHRVGGAVSQESLRYVRLDEMDPYIPLCIKENKEGLELFTKTVEYLNEIQQKLHEVYDIDNKDNFSDKKELTSAFRRIAPIGLPTTIGWSANFRTLRNVIELRTSNAAEEEIQLVFNKVKDIVKQRYPNIFGDM